MFSARFLSRGAWAAGGALLALALVYHLQTYVDFRHPGHGRVLHLRWDEEQYVYRGINPYDAYFWNTPRPEWPRDWHRYAYRPAALAPEIGWTHSIPNYPPWYYGWAAPFLWMASWPFLEWVFAVVNIWLMVLISRWVWEETREKPPEWRFLILASTLAISAYTTTLNMGQITIIATAALCLALRMEERPLPAGIGLATAAMKPSLMLFNYVVFLWRGRWKAVAVSAVILGVGCLATWAMIAVPPWVMLAQMARGASLELSIDGEGPIKLLALWGVNPRALTFGMMTAWFAVGVLALRVAERDLLTQFAIAAVVDRMAFHHTLYDNLMLIFLLVALGKRAFAPLRAIYAAGFGLVGLSLWIPNYFVARMEWIWVFQAVAWLAGLVLVAAPNTLDRKT